MGALSADEAGYVRAARAANTLRGYQSDWAEWCAWSRGNGYTDLPAGAKGISRYLTFLAGHGAKVGTMSRRLSGIRFAHKMHDLPDPTAAARVIAVWEGIRRTHSAPAEQAVPLMPPELWDIIDRCATIRTWTNPKRRPRRTWPACGTGRCSSSVSSPPSAAPSSALGVDQIAEHPNGLVISIARSKTNQDRRASRARRPSPGPHGRPLPRHRPPSMAHRRRHHRRPRLSGRLHQQPTRGPGP